MCQFFHPYNFLVLKIVNLEGEPWRSGKATAVTITGSSSGNSPLQKCMERLRIKDSSGRTHPLTLCKRELRALGLPFFLNSEPKIEKNTSIGEPFNQICLYTTSLAEILQIRKLQA
jgi:hypothetical protein